MQLGTSTIPLLPAVAVGAAVVLAVLVGWGVSRARRAPAATPAAHADVEEPAVRAEDWTGEAAGGMADPPPPRRTTVADAVAARGADTRPFPSAPDPAETGREPDGDGRVGDGPDPVPSATSAGPGDDPEPGASRAPGATSGGDPANGRPSSEDAPRAPRHGLPGAARDRRVDDDGAAPGRVRTGPRHAHAADPSATAATSARTAAPVHDPWDIPAEPDPWATPAAPVPSSTPDGTDTTSFPAVTDGSSVPAVTDASSLPPETDAAVPGAAPATASASVGTDATGPVPVASDPASALRGPDPASVVPGPDGAAATAAPAATEPDDPGSGPDDVEGDRPGDSTHLTRGDAEAGSTDRSAALPLTRSGAADTREPSAASTGDVPGPSAALVGDVLGSPAASAADVPGSPAASVGDAPGSSAASAGDAPGSSAASAGDAPGSSAASAGDAPGSSAASVGDAPGSSAASVGDALGSPVASAGDIGPEPAGDAVDPAPVVTGPVPPPWSTARSDPETIQPTDAAPPISLAVQQALAAREMQRAHGLEAGEMPGPDARDRLLSVLLSDPVTALGAATELDDTRARIDRLGDVLRRRRADLAAAVHRLHASGLTGEQIGRLSGLGDDDVRSILERRTEEGASER